jgi:hypothetical protein
LRLIDGRIRTLPSVLQIPGLAINLIFVNKMDDAGVKIVFEKETCRMVRGTMMLLKGFWIGNLYKLQVSTISDGCNISFVLDIQVEEKRTPTFSREKVLLHQRLGNIREKDLQLRHGKGMVEGISNFSLDFYFCCNTPRPFPSYIMNCNHVYRLVSREIVSW